MVANTAHASIDIGLRPKDVIHAKPIFSLAELQREIVTFEPGAILVLQIEKRVMAGGYITFQVE